MAVRVSMAGLIEQVRVLVGDPAGSGQALTDQQIQDVMDTHRWEARTAPLRGLVSYEAGSPVYKTWKAAYGHWEADAVLQDAQHQTLTPSAADMIGGRWTFATSQTGVYLTGWTYDLYAAAADLLEAWAARAAAEYDFTADGASFHRSQKGQALRTLAGEYRKKQQVKVGLQIREDVRGC